MRRGARKYVRKLKKMGFEIYIITGRDFEFHKDPYGLTKNWLDKHGFVYDKIIVNARDKTPACEEEKIDVMIDDKIKVAREVARVSTAICLTDEKPFYTDVRYLKNWRRVYKFISNMQNS